MPTSRSEDAQRNKYRRIAEGARLAAGQHVLEIGTGWGGFALYAAGELGCRVTTITISRAQFTSRASECATQASTTWWMSATRLPGRQRARMTPSCRSRCWKRSARSTSRRTSRHATGPRPRWPDVRPGHHISGRAYERQRRGANWIQTYIFPGGLCPSLAVIERATGDTRLLDRRGARHRRRLRPDAPSVADAVHGTAGRRSRQWASTNGSSGCGSTTSP